MEDTAPAAAPPGTDDAPLLAGLRAGDDGAYAALVRQNVARLLAVTRRILGNDDDAQDAVQDAFVSAFKNIDGFDGGAQLSTWLHRIAVNAALMRLRSRQRKHEQSLDDLLPKFLDDGHQAEPAVEWRAGHAELAERRETRELVRASIDRLPESYRVVLLLRDIEELDTEETARLLGVNAGVVKTRLHRARQALRALLDPHLRKGDV